MPVIALSGKKRSGKSTVAKRLVEEHGYVEVSFADPLKEVLRRTNPIVYVDHWGDEEWRVQDVLAKYSWDVAKEEFPEIRQLLQRLGTEGGREVLGPNVWIEPTLARINEYRRGGQEKFVVPDVRFRNEATALVHHQQATLVRVERAKADTTDTHPSETELDSYGHFHYTLPNNSSIKALHILVDRLAHKYRDYDRL